MAADSGPRWPSFLLLAVLAVTGYVAWQVAPLSGRMDALDRDRLETRDRLQRQIEQLRDQLERARFGGAGASAAAPAQQSSPSHTSAAQGSSANPAQSASAAAGEPARVSRVDAETYFMRRLLSEDATIASLLVEDVPAVEIARRLKHSPAFIVAKGIQIEKQLAAAPDTPQDILAALRAAVDRAKANR